MAQQTITYTDKVGLVSNPASAENKVSDTDMNELKTVINNNASDTQTQLDTKIDSADEGVANGVATLDSGGKVPVAQLPVSVKGGIKVIGTWDADTNTPDISALTLDQGEAYLVSVAGSTSLNGETNWRAKDLAVWDDSLSGNWFKLDNTDDVISINSKTGVVVLDPDDLDDTATTNKFVTASDITNLGNLSGTNTGDQDLSDYISKSATADQTMAGRLRAVGLSAGAPADSAWSSSAQVVTSGNQIYMYAFTGEQGIAQNAVYNGTNWEYVGNATATRTVYGSSGTLTHYTAVSGTNGNPVTWIPTQTIDNSGNLKLDQYTTAGALVNDASGNITSDAELIVAKGDHTATIAPQTSGTITATASIDTLRYRKTGTSVNVRGNVNVTSVSSPVGDNIGISLPYTVANLTENAERIGTAVIYNATASGTYTSLEAITVASGTTLLIVIDASTVSANDQFYLDFNYETT